MKLSKTFKSSCVQNIKLTSYRSCQNCSFTLCTCTSSKALIKHVFIGQKMGIYKGMIFVCLQFLYIREKKDIYLRYRKLKVFHVFICAGINGIYLSYGKFQAMSTMTPDISGLWLNFFNITHLNTPSFTETKYMYFHRYFRTSTCISRHIKISTCISRHIRISQVLYC